MPLEIMRGSSLAGRPHSQSQRGSRARKAGQHATVYSPSGEQYKGEFQDDRRHGRGVVTYSNGDRYEGDWHSGRRHGFGTLWVLRGGRYHAWYSGDWSNDMPHGSGALHEEDGRSYDGEWRMGLRHGCGREEVGGDVYEGFWEQDMRHGTGTLLQANGDVFEGEWARGLKHGQGTQLFMANGRRLDGLWVEGVARCGTYAEVEPAPPGAPGSLPNVELSDPEGTLQRGALVALERLSLAGAAAAAVGHP